MLNQLLMLWLSYQSISKITFQNFLMLIQVLGMWQDRPWVCGVCGTGHARKEHLDRHQVTHSDARPYPCPACPKTFKRNEHLSRHLVIHSGQKMELCRECGKTFYRKDHLRKHAESHHNKRSRAVGANTPSTVNHHAVMSKSLVLQTSTSVVETTQTLGICVPYDRTS